MVKRIAAFVYGSASYALFLATFLYAVGLIGDIAVPKSMDSGPRGPLGEALLVDALLLAAFALQHSVMARPAFKRLWTRIVPEPIERSTYVLASSVALLVLFWQWRPIGGLIWQVDDPTGRVVLHAVYAVGWLTVLASTLLINHFDLFGLRQVWLYLRDEPYTSLAFGTPGLYRWVRHPLYVGWLLAIWATPTMTATHLVFALATTGYILGAIQLEERDLIRAHGHAYRTYREEVPMLVPRMRARERAAAASVGRARS